MIIPLDSRRALRALVAVAFALTALSAVTWLLRARLGVGLFGLGRLFGIGLEQSLPTWYAVLLLASAAALLWACASGEAARGAKDVLAWRALAGLFLLISVDEQVGLHETAGRFMRHGAALDGFLYFAWVVPALGALAVLAACFSGFLLRLDPRRRNQFVLAGALYVLGAVGMEMVGGKIYSAHGQEVYSYVACVHAEELLELLGVSLFVSALIEHLAGLYGRDGVALRFIRG